MLQKCSVKFYTDSTFSSPMSVKDSVHKVKCKWLWKRTEALQTKILFEKGCDFSKSLEPNSV